jgi:hypothetical protein
MILVGEDRRLPRWVTWCGMSGTTMRASLAISQLPAAKREGQSGIVTPD